MGANASLTGISGDAGSSAGAPAGATTNRFTGARFGADATNTPNATALGMQASAIGSVTSNTGVNAIASINGTSINNAGIVTAVGPLATVGGAALTARTGRNAALVAVNPNAASTGTGNTERAIYSSGGVQLENLGTTTATKLVGIDANGNLSTTTMAGAITADNGLTKTLDNIQLGGALTKQTTITTDATNNLIVNATAIGGASSEANQGLNVLATATTNSANAIALRGRVLQTAGIVTQLRGVTGVSTLTGGTVSGSSNGGYFNNQLSGGTLGNGAVMSAVSGDVEATSGTANASNAMIGGRFGSALSGTVTAGRAVGILATAGGSTTANIGSISVINDPTLTNPKLNTLGVAVGGIDNGAAVVAINPTTTANNYAIYSDGNVAMKSLPTTGSTALVGIDANGNLSTTAIGGAITADNGLTKTGSNVQLGGTLIQPTALAATGTNNLVVNATDIGSGNNDLNQGFTVISTAKTNNRAIGTRSSLIVPSGVTLTQARGNSSTANIEGTISGTATGAYMNTVLRPGSNVASGNTVTGASGDIEVIAGTGNLDNTRTLTGARFGADATNGAAARTTGITATAVNSTSSNIGVAASANTTEADLKTNIATNLPTGTSVANYSYAPTGLSNFATYSDGNVVMKNISTGIASSNFLVIDGGGSVKQVTGAAIIAAANLDGTNDAWVNVTGAGARVELGTLAAGGTRPAGTEVVATDAGSLGLGVVAPTNKLHVNAAANPLRLEGLQAGAAADEILSVDATGVVRKKAGPDLRLVGTGNHISQDAGVGSNGTSAGTGYSNIIVGNGNVNYPAAGNSMTTGYRNIFLGETVGNANTTGYRNTIVGAPSFTANTTGNFNTAFGNSTLRFSNGDFNTVLGTYTMNQNTTGSENTAIGANALYENKTGVKNTALGWRALGGAAGGSSNIGIGYNTGINVGGSNNIIIGNLLDIQNTAANNQLNIGNIIYGTAVDGTGATLSTGNVGIGVKNPTAKLEVNGKIKATDVNFSGLPVFANEGAAGILTTGDMYRTGTGELRIKL